jgi:hypothetical protein
LQACRSRLPPNRVECSVFVRQNGTHWGENYLA